MDCLDTLLRSFYDYCEALDNEEAKTELPAMSPELAGKRAEIERFYLDYVDMVMSGNEVYKEYTLTADEPPALFETKTLDELILTNSQFAELVKIHEYMLLRESRNNFGALLQRQDGATIRITEINVPF